METPQLNQVFKNTETPQKFCGNASRKRGNTSTLNIRKCLKNIRKSPNIFQFWGISQKKTEIPQNRFLRHFRVETFLCWGVSIAPPWNMTFNNSLFFTVECWVRVVTLFIHQTSYLSHTNKHISYSLPHISCSRRTKKPSLLFYVSLCLLNFKQMSHGIIKQV